MKVLCCHSPHVSSTDPSHQLEQRSRVESCGVDTRVALDFHPLTSCVLVYSMTLLLAITSSDVPAASPSHLIIIIFLMLALAL